MAQIVRRSGLKIGVRVKIQSFYSDPNLLRPGDYLEFGNIGAYSISGRTDYNGYYSNRIVMITSPTEKPPSVQKGQKH
jgi:hypothetical protein